MSISIGSSSLSRVLTSSFSTSTTCQRLKRNSKPSLSWRLFDGHRRDLQRVINAKGDSSQFVYGTLKAKKEFQTRLIPFATSENHELDNELNLDVSEQENHSFVAEDIPLESNSVLHFARTDGKSGFISFYGRSSRSDRKKEEEVFAPLPSKNGSNLFSFIGPTILVASFIIPSLYLRRIVSSIFEDSLLTDFLILFFTEALFYCGVAAFLLLIDHLQRPFEPISSSKSYRGPSTQLVHRVSSGTALALSLIIPMVTMGLVWPWTGPAASATLAPFLVGIVVQFAFEQYARYLKSPSWPVIPIIFQVYRLHQLNRAAQLVTALSFTVRGAEATSHNLAINSSLATLLNVLQFLGIICIWSLASFLMRFFPSSSAIPQS